MADVLTPTQRSLCMSRIKNKDTKPEIAIRKRLWAKGYRYRIGHGLLGKPDIVFVAKKVAIFIDGCFWHKCPIHYKLPKTNTEFWKGKIDLNVARDREVENKLVALGWTVIRLWEHEVKKEVDGAVETILDALGE